MTGSTFSRDELVAAFAEFEKTVDRAASTRNWDPWVAQYTDDVLYVEHAAGTMRGREEVRPWIWNTMETFPGSYMTSFPALWKVFDEETGRVICELDNPMRDPGDGTAALKLWAELSERLDRGPDGLAALRQAAQAGRGGDPELATLIEGFQERHGFRVSDSRVDSDAADPRACVVFSDALADTADYRPFVALPDPAMAVEAQGSELCVTGLTRGQALRLTLRQDGEVLARAVDLSLYVRDRNPQARFGGRAYLLPAAGDQGLTLRTVNADGVDLTLYRMSDRNLVRALADQIFATPLDDWKAGTFTSDMGQEVWRGHADVAPAPGGGAHPVNAEVATRLDLRQAAGPLSPGIYALTAAVPGQSPDRSPPATQWFMISDLGLASYAGSDGMTVVVRGLSDAGPRAGVTVQLLSRGNAVLGTARTDDQGIARFDAGLVRGTGSAEPAVVTALVQDGGDAGTGAPTDMAFMSLLDPEFDLSDRGVEGAPPAPPIDVFVATDRGAYRAGEVAHATVMTRDERAQAIDGLPLTAVVIRPDGVEHARLMPAPAGAGGYVLDVPIPDTAPRGVWRIDFRVEESGPALASKDVLVEDFRPERIAFDLALPDAPLPAGQPVEADIAARWLFGAPAAGLPVEGELRLTPARALPGFDGFQFGRHDDDASPEIVAMPSGTTDAEGRFTARIDLPPALAQATQPFDARLTLTVREGAARLRVNLFDYLDTGLFLDHRPLRARMAKEARGKRFLNLFCYTGVASVQAAMGAAAQTTSIDLSSTYLDWLADNPEAARAALNEAWAGLQATGLDAQILSSKYAEDTGSIAYRYTWHLPKNRTWAYDGQLNMVRDEGHWRGGWGGGTGEPPASTRNDNKRSSRRSALRVFSSATPSRALLWLAI